MTATLQVTAFSVAQRFIGLAEVAGVGSNPLIVGMLQQDARWLAGGDETPWCSAFVNFIARILGLPRSRSLAARSWLKVGQIISPSEAHVGFDVVVLQRGGGKQPGAEVVDAPGHVGLFAGWSNDGKDVLVLGGNQGDEVSIDAFPVERILGVRRLWSG